MHLVNQQQSVVKQIIIDEDDFYKVTGISFIVLLIIVTVAFYYRKDIKEINKKPTLPSLEELNNNPRSRSAKLRICEKL